jgi:hypothetical protein
LVGGAIGMGCAPALNWTLFNFQPFSRSSQQTKVFRWYLSWQLLTSQGGTALL